MDFRRRPGQLLNTDASCWGNTGGGFLYLVESEGSDAVGGQLHGVQHGDLDHPVGLGSSRRPVLVTLHLAEGEKGRAVRTELASSVERPDR